MGLVRCMHVKLFVRKGETRVEITHVRSLPAAVLPHCRCHAVSLRGRNDLAYMGTLHGRRYPNSELHAYKLATVRLL
eukprot:2541158-Pleurochrysis_carterae.AAC.1